jgi:hypothetical protein
MKKRILTIAMAIALVAVIAMPMAAFAALNGTTIISGDVSSNLISISALPAGGSLGSLVVNGTKSYLSAQSITITGSGDTYNLIVRDDNQDTDIGHMIVASNVLAAELEVKGRDILAYTPLPETAGLTLTLEDAGNLSSGTDTINDFNVRQAVSFADPAADAYTITLYFEVAYN